MDKEKTISEIVSRLEAKKYDFLNEVESSIKYYIENQGASCLAINKVYSSGSIYHSYALSASIEYIEVLIAFCRAKSYEGWTLDSGLTPGVVSRVTQKFEKFYEDNNEEITKAILKSLVSDKVVVQGVVNGILENSITKEGAKQIGTEISHATVTKAADLISDQLQTIVHSSAFQTITTTTTHVVGSALSAPVVKAIAVVIIKSLSTHIGAVVAKILASTAFKTAIGAAIKKFLGGILLASVAKALAAKFGIGLGAAIAWILLPIIVAYIAYEIYHFPKELAEKVSSKVRSELSGEYNNINKTVLSEIFANIGGQSLASIIMADANVNEHVQDFVEKLGQNST